MRARMRISALAAGLGAALAGCDAPPGAAVPPQVPGAGAPPVTAAFFAETPEMLLAAARKACNAPGEEFVRPHAGVVQCRLLMDPRTTAAVILNFDGDIENLPQLVISLASARVESGHLVTGCAFLKVPRKDGRIGRIVQNDRRVDAKLRQMLEAVGGTPVRDVPRAAADRCFAL